MTKHSCDSIEVKTDRNTKDIQDQRADHKELAAKVSENTKRISSHKYYFIGLIGVTVMGALIQENNFVIEFIKVLL